MPTNRLRSCCFTLEDSGRVVRPLAFVIPLCLALVNMSAASDVAYVEGAHARPDSRANALMAAQFYGLQLEPLSLRSASQGIAQSAAVALLIDASAIPYLDRDRVFGAMRGRNAKIPVLISGIDENTDTTVLQKWSAGAITDCTLSTIPSGRSPVVAVLRDPINSYLSAAKLPLKTDLTSTPTLNLGVGAKPLLQIDSGGRLAIFAVAEQRGHEVFFAAANLAERLSATADPYREPAAFTSLAPQLIFLRYAAGAHAWHAPGPYANLTIDDAALREPFGHVVYAELLKQMQDHNFHTTVGFVPWNFDRTQSEVRKLFRRHPDRFSIAVHGNNHDHEEFGTYDLRPLIGQDSNIKQAVARMDKFSALTFIPYDRVMIFPHEISPSDTLALLKRYNFRATVNFLNVPLGVKPDSDLETALRPVTLKYHNFPSLRRYSAEAPIPDSQFAVDAFLGNPILIYVHQAYFSTGIDAFNNVADAVNRARPGTRWQSLGTIAQHLYLERSGSQERHREIRAYTSDILLENPTNEDITYTVEKEEDFALPLSVLVGGQEHPFSRSSSGLRIELSVPARAKRQVQVLYRTDVDFAHVDVSKKSFRIALIRWLSDFRDDVVSRSSIGRSFIRSYTARQDLWITATAAALLSISTLVLVIWLRRRTYKGTFSH